MLWESRIRELERQKVELIAQVGQIREALDEHVGRLSKQVSFQTRVASEKRVHTNIAHYKLFQVFSSGLRSLIL